MNNNNSQEFKEPTKSKAKQGIDLIVYFLTEVAKLVRDFGMPVVMFGMGLYIFGLVVTGDALPPSYKVGVGLFLTGAGLVSWLWIYGREHPLTRDTMKREDRALEHHLERVTKMLERLVTRDQDRSV